MNNLVDIINTIYGTAFGIILLSILAIFAIITIFVPFFIWGIHNQTTRTAKELIKLNKILEGRKSQQLPKDSQPEQSTAEQPKDRRPEQISRRKKIFHEADYDPQDQKEKLS